MEMITPGHLNPKYRYKRDYFEQKAWSQGKLVVGIDEVGRGCLAGPVVTAAVAILCKKRGKLLNDSKLLTAQEREKAFEWIEKNCIYSIGIGNHRVIDAINIRQATLKVMRKCAIQLIAQHKIAPECILIDAMPVDIANTSFESIPQLHFFEGEKHSCSIAAASIVAKVTRDRLMQELSASFPLYDLGQHKGYATKKHVAAVEQHGNSLIHRLSFILEVLNKVTDQKKDMHELQQALW